MTIGQQFKNFRKSHKITQTWLQKETGINRSTIWRLENNKDISFKSFEKLIEAINAKIIIIDKEI